VRWACLLSEIVMLLIKPPILSLDLPHFVTLNAHNFPVARKRPGMRQTSGAFGKWQARLKAPAAVAP